MEGRPHSSKVGTPKSATNWVVGNLKAN